MSSDVSTARGQLRALRIATRQSQPGSTFKEAFFSSDHRVGRITQVGGEFTPPTTNKPVVCVAGGIGITPFASWIRSLHPTPDNPVNLWLFVVVKRSGELLYPELGVIPGVTLVPVDNLDQLKNIVGDVGQPLSDCVVAVSGSPAFVTEATKTLRGVGARHVLTDRFIGY